MVQNVDKCGGFCRLIHLARTIPPSLAGDALSLFDDEVRQCFAECTAVDTPDFTWQQAQLSLSLLPLSCCIFSLSCQFKLTTPIDRARLLSISSPHASAWLSVTPSPSIRLHLEPSEFQVAIKWWLGIPVAQGQSCSQCNAALDAYGHHALCCKLGGDVSRHNRLRDIFNDFSHSACLAPQLEMGGWSRDRTRPADVLVPNWVLGKPAAFDLSVTSTLNAQIFQEACVTASSAALAAQIRKHRVNDERCRDLGWACISLVVETYGCWGTEVIQALSRLATHLSTRQGHPKSLVSNEMFGRLSLALVRANSRAILSRSL